MGVRNDWCKKLFSSDNFYDKCEKFSIRTQATFWDFVDTFCSKLNVFATNSRVCRTKLTRSALESTNAGASNSESNIKIDPLRVDHITFELVELLNITNFSQHFYQLQIQLQSYLAISKVTRSTPCGRNLTFDPPSAAPGSVLSSAV